MRLFRLITAPSLLGARLIARRYPTSCEGCAVLCLRMQFWPADRTGYFRACSSVTLRIIIRWSILYICLSVDFESGVLVVDRAVRTPLW